MVEAISQTITEKRLALDDVFTEIEHEEKLDLPRAGQLRLFRTSFRANKLTTEGLQEFIYRNLAHYVFSRAKLEDYRVNEELDIAVSQALRIMAENGGLEGIDVGNALDEILLYAFLEIKLKAPKLMSRVELETELHQFRSECKGVHLLSPKDLPENTKFELVFGASNIVNDIKTAIDKTFETVVKIDKRESREVLMVQKTVLEQFFDDSEIDLLKAAIVPDQQGQPKGFDTAYGLFLGYKLGLKAEGRGPEFEELAQQKMLYDIKNHAAYIAQKIRGNHLDTHAFYVYVVPFNDADAEKKTIMEPVLNGEIIL